MYHTDFDESSGKLQLQNDIKEMMSANQVSVDISHLSTTCLFEKYYYVLYSVATHLVINGGDRSNGRATMTHLAVA